jgi:hypothetical protein
MVMSPISTSYGCSTAKAMARATASGEMADTRARHLLQVVLDGLRQPAQDR